MDSEEKYPLLLLYVEEGGKRSEYPRRVVVTDRSRGKNVIHGAATVITQWPGHLTSCWVTSLVLGSSFILLSSLLMLASFNPMLMYHTNSPRCVRDISHHDNKTIHIVHEGITWDTKQLDLLKYIADIYSDYDIHVLSFEGSPKIEPIKEESVVKIIVENNISKNAETTTKKIEIVTGENNKTEEENEMIFYSNPFKHFNAISFLEKIRRNMRSPGRYKRNIISPKVKKNTLEDLLKKYKNIKPENTTYKKYFTSTPLQYYWMNLDTSMLSFASRIQELWQYGGLSFYIPPNIDQLNTSKQIISNDLKKPTPISIPFDPASETRLKNVISNSKALYEKLEDDLVSIDGKGLHMGTKTACHSFFGEMMIKLISRGDISVPTLIQETLDAFCKRGAVDSEYCKAIQN